MSNLKPPPPAFSVIPHAPGLAGPPGLVRPVASPGIAHAPGLARPIDKKPPPVHHAPGLPAHQQASRDAAHALLAQAHAPVVTHAPALVQTPHGEVKIPGVPILGGSRGVPFDDFERKKRLKREGDPSIGLAPPNAGSGAADDAPPEKRPLQGKHSLNRGRSLSLAPVKVGNVTLDLVSIVAVPGIASSIVETGPDIGEDAEAIAIQLGGPIYDDTDPTTGQPSLNNGQLRVIQALLQWGVGGCQFQSMIDWENGAVIVVHASYVRVGAAYTAFGAPGALTPVNAKLSASLAYGTPLSPRSGGPRLTVSSAFNQFALGGWAAPVLIPVPAFATSFGLAVKPHAFTDTTLLEINTIGAGTTASYSYNSRSNSAQQIESSYPIPNGTTYLSIVDHSTPANPDNLTIIFGLSL